MDNTSQIENCKSSIENARKGIGGPKTAEGKAKSKMNALKYGLHAQTLEGIKIVEEMIGCSYMEMLEQMYQYYKPMDPLEEVLVKRIARCAWRMIVTQSAENTVLARCAQVTIRIDRAYQRVLHAERFVDVHLHRAIAALQNKRNKEYDRNKNELRRIEQS